MKADMHVFLRFARVEYERKSHGKWTGDLVENRKLLIILPCLGFHLICPKNGKQIRASYPYPVIV